MKTDFLALEAVYEEVSLENTERPAGTIKQRSIWARLIKKVYGINPLVCPKCGSDMEVKAIITEPVEIEKILKHLVKIGRPPPNFDINSLNKINIFLYLFSMGVVYSLSFRNLNLPTDFSEEAFLL